MSEFYLILLVFSPLDIENPAVRSCEKMMDAAEVVEGSLACNHHQPHTTSISEYLLLNKMARNG